jgi:tetratricopeptide (TPR) repeat protein
MTRRSFPHIDPATLRDHADDARVERVWQRLEPHLEAHHARQGARPGRARSTVAIVAIAATFGAFGAGLFAGKATWGTRAAQEVAVEAAPALDRSLVEVLAAGTQQRTFPLQGGGTVTLSPGATVEVERAGSDVTLSLLQGEASVDSAKRALTIAAGDARINTQAGSVLSVRRNLDDVDVKVDDGSVSVSSPAGPAQIGKNQRETVPLHTAIVASSVDSKPAPARALPVRRGSPRGPLLKTAGPDWLVRLNAQDDEGALALLKKRDLGEVIASAHSAAELISLGDLMRGKGKRPDAAIRAYARIVEAFKGDGYAYFAAKSLASMYDGAGNHELAEAYQAQANQLAPTTAGKAADSIYCDAIKAQMRKETDKTRAAGLAKEYLDKYPDGVCHEELEQIAQSTLATPPAPPLETPPPPAAP